MPLGEELENLWNYPLFSYHNSMRWTAFQVLIKPLCKYKGEVERTFCRYELMSSACACSPLSPMSWPVIRCDREPTVVSLMSLYTQHSIVTRMYNNIGCGIWSFQQHYELLSPNTGHQLAKTKLGTYYAKNQIMLQLNDKQLTKE